VLLAVATVLAAAFVAGPTPDLTTAVDSPPIDLTAEVNASNCVPCHPAIGTARTPGLIFNHASHLMTACPSCHFVNAHQDGESATPTMASCFNCHGIAHGQTGVLAGGTCADCHTEDHTLRPVTHVKDWKERPHALASFGNVNQCVLCHEAPKDCDECHATEAPDVPPMPSIYLRVLPTKPEQPSVFVDPDDPPSAAQCAFCHRDFDDIKPGRIIFTHENHLERDYKCTVCHPRFSHQPAGIEYNSMQACYRCHGLTHASQGEVATEKCEDCHPKEFPLEPADHTVAYKSGEHNEQALEAGASCTMCHKADFCVECHKGGTKLADGKLGVKVVPEDHRKPEWMTTHGGLYLGQEGQCGVCHDSPSCQRCHQTTMPHPTTWLEVHAKGNGSLADDCNVCHQDRQACQECHHSSVRSVELVLKNCEKCHPEMKTEPATDIKVAGLAEHAVHFIVAQPDKRGKPYVCDDCHIGFGTSKVHISSALSGPHDMRFCYDCHGGLDIDNVQIAPYPGAELCLRCHKDLNF
jgi:hypothetical protein